MKQSKTCKQNQTQYEESSSSKATQKAATMKDMQPKTKHNHHQRHTQKCKYNQNKESSSIEIIKNETIEGMQPNNKQKRIIITIRNSPKNKTTKGMQTFFLKSSSPSSKVIQKIKQPKSCKPNQKNNNIITITK